LTLSRHHLLPTSADLAGSLPNFPPIPGGTLARSLALPDFRRKRLLFNQLTSPGQVHVYSTECRAGDRLRAQMLLPVLPHGGAVTPAFAVVAQSLPYSADVLKLPLTLPAGYSAVVASPPAELLTPMRDLLTRAHYYAGPLIDTRTLVGGRAYVIVWSPHNQTGKYLLQVGHQWSWQWGYWAQLPRYWWQIRGWFGLSRRAAYVTLAIVLLALGLSWRMASNVNRET
jgi:hypothetical protein